MADDLPVRESVSVRQAVTFNLTDKGLVVAPDQTITAESDQREEAPPLTNVTAEANSPEPSPEPAAPPEPPLDLTGASGQAADTSDHPSPAADKE